MDNSTKDLPKKDVENLKILEQELTKATNDAYTYAVSDPAGSMNKARTAAELICCHLIVEHKLVNNLEDPPKSLDKMLVILRKNTKVLPELYALHATTLQHWGNFGSHANGTPTYKDILPAILALKFLTDWFCDENGLAPIPFTGSPSETLLPAMSDDISEPGTSIVPMNSVDFISAIKRNPKNIQSVCMAFHAGVEWRSDSEKVALVNFMRKKKIPLRIIVNNAGTVRNICPHMQQEGKEYVGFRRSIKHWRKEQKRSKGIIEVRVSTIPMLHRIYIVHTKDLQGAANIKYYTFGNDMPAKDPRSCFSSDSREFNLYKREFNYLWEKAIPIQDFTPLKPFALLKHLIRTRK